MASTMSNDFRVLHRNAGLIAFSISFALGMTLSHRDTFTNDKNLPIWVQFYTGSRLLDEIKNILNPREDPPGDIKDHLANNYR